MLGPAIIELDRLLRITDPLLLAAQRTLHWLAGQIDVECTLLLCRRYRDQVLCIHQEQVAGSQYRSRYQRGLPLPLLRGAGSKVILAHLPSARRSEHLRRLEAEGRHERAEQLRAQLRKIRREGYCLARGELEPTATGLAVPLFDTDGVVVGSLCASFPAEPASAVLARLKGLLMGAAEEVRVALAAPGPALAPPKEALPS